MVQIIGRHATTPDRRESIRKHGLLPHTPAIDGNYTDTYDGVSNQPRGVYLDARDGFTKYDYPGTGWSSTELEARWNKHYDIWEAVFTGPLQEDPIINGAIVSKEAIPPENLRLIQRGNPLT